MTERKDQVTEVKVDRRQLLTGGAKAAGALAFGIAALQTGEASAMNQQCVPSGSGFFFPEGFATPNPTGKQIAEDFLNDPDAFLNSRGLDYVSMRCPDDLHDALDNAEAFKAQAVNLLPLNDSGDVASLKALAQTHFGSNYEVYHTPFGLQFQEAIGCVDSAGAFPPKVYTVSGTVTFLDGDVDTDG